MGGWWARQPEGMRRAVKAATVEGGLILAGGLLGGRRWAMIAALLGTPVAMAYALSSDVRSSEQAPVEPKRAMPRPVAAPLDQLDAVIGVLSVCASSAPP